MVSAFAISILILNVLGLGSIFSLPLVLRWQTEAKFRDFGLGEAAIRDAVNSEMAAAAPSLTACFVFCMVGIVSAIGILNHHDWARRLWIADCLLWLVAQMAFAIWIPPWDFEDTTILVFRLVILCMSVWVLYGADGRREFLPRMGKASP